VAKFRFYWILLWVAILCGLDCDAQAPGASVDEKRRSAGYYYRVGEVQIGKHEWIAARDALNSCLREDPMYVDAYYSRALVNEHFDSLDQALTDYNIYLEFRPGHHEALFGRAQLRMRMDQNALARSDLLRLLSLPSGETTSVFFRQDVYSGGVDQVFTSKGANKSYIYNALGLTTMRLNAYDEAIGYFDSAVSLSPDDPDLYVNRGMAKEKKSDTTEAINDYQRALMYNPQHAVAKTNLSAISKGKNVADRDPTLLDEAIEDNPKLPFAYAERAWLNFQKGNFTKAIQDYNEAISLDPSQPEYFLNRGLAREKLKDTQGAYSDYTAAIKIRNDFEKAWLNRGNLLARTGKLNEAVEDYTVAITHFPEYASAFFNRAMVLNRLQKRDLACADLQTAEKLGVKVEPKAWKSVCGN
jgi:tetratricopeptide (TPR) repeat protein